MSESGEVLAADQVAAAINGRVLTAEEILSKKDRGTKKVYVEKWGGHVLLRALSSDERDEWEWFVHEMKTKLNTVRGMRARLVAKSMINEDGTTVLTTDRQAKELGTHNAEIVDMLYDECVELSGLSKAAIEVQAGN